MSNLAGGVPNIMPSDNYSAKAIPMTMEAVILCE